MNQNKGKNITRDQIIDTALELINAKESIREVNFREIARRLGCAHTNLYNYFHDFEEILWKSVDVALWRLSDYVIVDLDKISDTNSRLASFFARFIDFYLSNKGWFKLIWFEKIGGPRPGETTDSIRKVVHLLTGILYELYNGNITKEEIHDVLHIVHCYLHGEISIYISGRGRIKEETAFKDYVKGECLRMINLLILAVQESKSN